MGRRKLTIVPDPVLTEVMRKNLGTILGVPLRPVNELSKFKRIVDPEIRRCESAYRRSVAAGRPDLESLAHLQTLQKMRQKMTGKKLRGFGRQGKLL
jgi:hypothetical protein